METYWYYVFGYEHESKSYRGSGLVESKTSFFPIVTVKQGNSSKLRLVILNQVQISKEDYETLKK